jgi:hypothetical protein
MLNPQNRTPHSATLNSHNLNQTVKAKELNVVATLILREESRQVGAAGQYVIELELRVKGAVLLLPEGARTG